MEIKGEGALHLHPTFKARVNNNFFDATEATVDLGQTFRVSNTYQRFVLLFCDNKNNRHILDVLSAFYCSKPTQMEKTGNVESVARFLQTLSSPLYITHELLSTIESFPKPQDRNITTTYLPVCALVG